LQDLENDLMRLDSWR